MLGICLVSGQKLRNRGESSVGALKVPIAGAPRRTRQGCRAMEWCIQKWQWQEKQRRKSREMIMFPQAHPSQLTWSTKMNLTPTGKAAWVEETHLAKISLSHPIFHGNVALCMPQVPPSSSPRLWGELAPRATATLK